MKLKINILPFEVNSIIIIIKNYYRCNYINSTVLTKLSNLFIVYCFIYKVFLITLMVIIVTTVQNYCI